MVTANNYHLVLCSGKLMAQHNDEYSCVVPAHECWAVALQHPAHWRCIQWSSQLRVTSESRTRHSLL